MLGDAPAMREDLRTLGVLLGRQIANLLQQRHIDVRLDIAGDAGVSVPVPGAADVGRLVDQPDVGDAEFPQPGTGKQTAEPGADDRDVDLVGDRLTRFGRTRPRVGRETGEITGHLDVLTDTVRAQRMSRSRA